MNLTWIWDLETCWYFILRIIKTLVLKCKCHLQILKSIPQFVGFAEKTCKIVVCDCSHPIISISEQLCFFQQFLTKLVVFLLEMCHAQDVANYGYFIVNSCKLFNSALSIFLLNQLLSFIELFQSFNLISLLFQITANVKQLLDLVSNPLHALKLLFCHFI